MKKLLALALVVASAPVWPLHAVPTPAAQAAFEEARPLFSSDINACVAGLRKAVELDPEYYEAHQYYIACSNLAATRSGTEEEKKAAGEKAVHEIEALYTGWAEAHPQTAGYQYGLGLIFGYRDPDRARSFFVQAVKLNAQCSRAYDMLAIGAEVRGDLAGSREWYRRELAACPDDVTLWRHYVGSFVYDDLDGGVAAGLEMAKKFPDGAASIISFLATRSRDEAKARQILELLREKFPVASASNLTALFSIYLKSDPAKALLFARDMAALVPDNKQWPVLVNYAQAVNDTDALIAAGKAAEARAALDKIVLPRDGADRRALDLAKARATAAGEGGTVKAYAELLALFTQTPTDEVHAALVGYGDQLGKTPAAVEAEVMAQRDAAARPGIPFTLVNYRTGKPVSLADYQGRVVLVNFWYPMCGPCRGEFPFLNAVLEKYRSRGFEILAINGHPPEDHMVLSLLQGWKLGFLPLKGNEGGVVKDYQVRAFPANFLYGPDGRIYYQPSTVNTLSAQRELELQVEALLTQVKATPKTS